jgi:DNA-binding CsgD family transcriptional regulator
VLRQRLGRLSDREREVLRLILTEHGPTQIAVKLHLSVNTVHSHRTNMMQKLELSNPLGLAAYLPLLLELDAAD